MWLKLYYPILGLALLLSISSKAQFENIDLNKYKLTDYHYKTLGISLNTSNSNGFSSTNLTNNFFSSEGNSSYFNLGTAGNMGYTSTIYNRKYFGSKSVGFGFSNMVSRNSYENSNAGPTSNDEFKAKTSNSGSNISFNFSTDNRFYFTNDFFVGVNFQTSMMPFHSYSKSETTHNNNLNTSSVTANTYSSISNASFYLGKGRFENVTDARLAIYILDDLTKQGRLSRIPNQEEVFAFADLITKTLNNRVIDNRVKRIKEFVAVDSFLVSNGISSKTDGLYFGLINDNWNYGRIQHWGTGSSWHLGVSPSLDYNSYFSKSIDTNTISKNWKRLNQYGISFDAGYGSSWISGLKWLKGYDISASFNIFKLDSSGYFNDVHNYKSLTGNARYNISYIPNTRTSITVSAGVTVIKNLNKDTNNELQIVPLISGSCQYYFSERFRLQVNANINYNYYKIYELTSTQKTLNFGLNAALSYYIF